MENEEQKISASEYLVSAVKKLKPEEDPGDFFPSIFIGWDNKTHRTITETAVAWLSYSQAKEMNRESEAKIYERKFLELAEEHFPELSVKEVGEYVSIYFTFARRYLSSALVMAGDLIENDDFVNRINRAKPGEPETLIPFINPIKPVPRSTQTQSERMRRRYYAGIPNSPDSLTVVLHNSFFICKIRRPTRSDLIKLINDIEISLRYFGERWIINSINLERAGIAKKIVDFFLNLVIQHNVKDIFAVEELKNYILMNDVETMAVALLQAGAPKGVYYHLNCINGTCNHSEVVHIDPYDLMLVNDTDMYDGQRDLMYEMVNAGKTISTDELQNYQNRYRYKGEELDTSVKIYENPINNENEKAIGQFTLSVPTVAEYFTSFDLVAEMYDSTIKKYAVDYPDPKIYRKKRAEFMGSIRMAEYVHWVKNYVSYGDPDTETEDVIEDRSESQREFEKGLLEIYGEDEILYVNSLVKITDVVPFMSHVFFGIRNSECPSCHGKPNVPDLDKNGKEIEKDASVPVLARKTGFTPIDVVTNFFDLTRAMIEHLGTTQQAIEESIS